MTRARAKRLERDLLLERERLQREIERLTTPPSDASEARGRFGDDEVTSTAGNSAEVDDALAVRAARELDDVDRALVQLSAMRRTLPGGFPVAARRPRALSGVSARRTPSRTVR